MKNIIFLSVMLLMGFQAEAQMKIGQAIYGSGDEGADGAGAEEENVQDAEFKDKDEEKKA